MCHCSFPTSAARAGQAPSLGDPSPPHSASLENPEAWIWGGRPASLPGGGVWLAQDPWWGAPAPGPRPPGPGSGPPPFLAGSLLLAGCSRSGAERPPRAPSSPHPPSSPAQKQPHAPPQPTAHKSLSPRDLACPFHVPAVGDLPFQCGRQLLVSRPLKHGCGPACGPPSRGVRGALQGGKDSFATFPES